jgi:hypothetical protein
MQSTNYASLLSVPYDLNKWITPPTNYIGTALFLSYIAAALYFTFSIFFIAICTRWHSQQSSRKTKAHGFFAFASFAILSANMIAVLVTSFLGYHSRVGLRPSWRGLWPWMINSNLFYDFAQDLRANEAVVSWTRQGLFMTMALGLEISQIGKQAPVPAIGQQY